MILKIPPPSSGGIILSYQCSNRCRHCLYASSPHWREWMSTEDIDKVLEGLKSHSRYLTSLHIGGGEPLLKPELTAYTVGRAMALNLPLDYVETNAFWCWSDEKTESVFLTLHEAGLRGLMISVSPFHLEFVPMERVDRAIRIAGQVFGQSNVFLYTKYYYEQFQELDRKFPIPLEEYLDAVGREKASLAFATEYAMIPNGRAAVELVDLYELKSASSFFGETCRKELSSPHHVHIDCYGNYLAGLCGGIVLGDARCMDDLMAGIDLENHPFLRRVIEGGMEALLSWAVDAYDFRERPEGYMAKCHLCLDIRRHLVSAKADLVELAPAQFYDELSDDSNA